MQATQHEDEKKQALIDAKAQQSLVTKDYLSFPVKSGVILVFKLDGLLTEAYVTTSWPKNVVAKTMRKPKIKGSTFGQGRESEFVIRKTL